MMTVMKGTSSAGNKQTSVEDCGQKMDVHAKVAPAASVLYRKWIKKKLRRREAGRTGRALTLSFSSSLSNAFFRVSSSTAGRMNIRNISTRDSIHQSSFPHVRPTFFTACIQVVAILIQFQVT